MAEPPASRSPRPPDRGDRASAAHAHDAAAGVIDACLRADLSLLSGEGTDLICRADRVVAPDVGAVDAVAHLARTARHHRLSLRVVGAPRALVDLLDLCGLADLLDRMEPHSGSKPDPGQDDARRG